MRETNVFIWLLKGLNGPGPSTQDTPTTLITRPSFLPTQGPLGERGCGGIEEPLLLIELVPGPWQAQSQGVQWGCVYTQHYPGAELGRPASGVRPGIHFPGEGLPIPPGRHSPAGG